MQLYEQTMDAQEGVVYFLLEEMEQQRIKENLLAYAMLLIRGESPHNSAREVELADLMQVILKYIQHTWIIVLC